MAKDSYSIRSSIDRSWFDHEISLAGKSVNMRPTPLKQLMFYGGGALIIIWSVAKTFIGSAGIGLIILYIVWALFVVAYLGMVTKTKELLVMTIPALLAYLPRSARQVYTRKDSNPNGFYSIVGIEDITEDGRITFADRAAGQIYRVVGTASYMLFDEDRYGILDRVKAFWQKVPPEAEFLFVTTTEPQRVHKQVANLERRNADLEIRDPDLLDLQDEELAILTQHVGLEFTSLHQYVMVRCKSAARLHQAEQVLIAEAEGSNRMLTELIALDRDESTSVLRDFYTGVAPLESNKT